MKRATLFLAATALLASSAIVMAGIYMPAPLVKGFENVARLLG